MDSAQSDQTSWLDRPLSFLVKPNIETFVVIVILILAVLSRFVGLGDRVMAHDEVNHVVPSYSLYHGTGYAYDPVTHGPLQFHLTALSYFILGDSDFASRTPDALVSFFTIVLVIILFRRYLGRTGAIVAGILFLISPFMMFYGRYIRNEVYGGLWTVLLIYGTLRYLEKGEKSSLYLLTVVMAFHFTDKATSFIYNAQLLLFLLVLFVMKVSSSRRWEQESNRRTFLGLIFLAILSLLLALFTAVLTATGSPAAASVVTGTVTDGTVAAAAPMQPPAMIEIFLVALAALFILGAVFVLVRNLGWKGIRSQRSFDLMMLVGTLTLPQLSAFPVRMLGWDPLDYTPAGMTRTALILVPLAILSILLGLWWKGKFWVRAAAIFYTIFTLLFTTFFTNGKGFFMGLVASLGYWLSQQGVARGSQPVYYYGVVQIPIYEYLAVFGALLALIIAIRRNMFSQWGGFSPAAQPLEPPAGAEGTEPSRENESPTATFSELIDQDVVNGEQAPADKQAAMELSGPDLINEEEATPLAGAASPVPEKPETSKPPVVALLLYWGATALVAYSLAGEKMPWLTVHIVGALLLASGWGIGYLIETTPWRKLFDRRGVIALLLLPVAITSLAIFLGALMGERLPFQGNTVDQLEATSTFVMSMIGAALSVGGLFWLLRQWQGRSVARLLALAFFGLCAVLTARTAVTASFINYDYATEFLVYAHAARGPKDILAQVEEISQRTTRGKDLVVAYDNESLYPYWWYFRDYPNKKYFADKPGRDIRDAAVILVGDVNYSKVEPIVKSDYIQYEYMRLWWPMQDYVGLDWTRIWNGISNPKWRQALMNIWLNRDYTLYAELSGSKNLTLEEWLPSARIRMYIRKDIVGQMWNYGATPASIGTAEADPYETGLLKQAPDVKLGSPGTQAGQFNAPRGIGFAPDGTFYVADSRNNRIQHLDQNGMVIKTWGTFADILKGGAPAGTLNEPWDVKVGPDGNVYVADTFNFRIQKFTADGEFIKMWGYFGQAEKPEGFWGPRALAFDAQGRLYVVDTGNKRVVLFTMDGTAVTSFGLAGFDPGQFDEPVGIAIDKEGQVYIADTWNQRIQIFVPDASGLSFLPLRNWEVKAWFGQSLDNKPFLALGATGNILVTDPDGGRILEFDQEGKYLRGITDPGDGSGIDLPSGIAVDISGKVWVSDAKLNRILRYTLPAEQSLPVQPSQPQIGPLK